MSENKDNKDKKIGKFNSNRKNRKFQKELRSAGKVEKSFQVVTEKEFVRKEEWNSADEPMPDITLRDLERLEKRKRREERRKLFSEEDDRENNIEISTPSDKIPEEEEAPHITVNHNDDPEAEQKKKEKKRKKKKEKENVTDIRAARQHEKNKKRIKNAAILVLVAAFGVSVYAFRDQWVPKLEGILDKPHETIVNDGKVEKGNFPITFDEGAVSKIAGIENSLAALDKNHLVVYDANGNEENSFNHNYADPVLKIAKKRMLVYDAGGNSFMVVNRKNEMFSKSAENRILMADIADNSNVAVVTQDEKYAGVLTVYDSNGSEIYQWSSSARILSINFSEDGNSCFVTTFTSKNGEIRSIVRHLKFDSTEEKMKSEPIDILALDAVRNDNGDYWVVGDTAFAKLDSQGNIIFECEYKSELVDYALTDECAAITMDGIKRNSTELMLFDSDSDKKEADKVIYTDDGEPRSVGIYNGKVIILKDKMVEAYDFSGNLLATADVSSEYFDFTFFNENVYFIDYREINKISFST